MITSKIYFPEPDGIGRDVPDGKIGCYCLVLSDPLVKGEFVFYVGVTKDIGSRITSHIYYLFENKHQVGELQDAYDKGYTDWFALWKVYPTFKEAWEAETILIDKNFERENCLNQLNHVGNKAIGDVQRKLNKDMTEEELKEHYGHNLGLQFGDAHEVKVGNEVYKSISEAAREYGISPHAAKHRFDSDSELFEDWQYTGVIHKQDLTGENNPMYGRTGEKSIHSRAIRIDGVEYASTKEAAQALDIPAPTIGYRLKVGWEGYERLTPMKKANLSRKVRIDGVVYNTIGDASRAVKMSRNGLKKRLVSRSYPTWEYVDVEDDK